VGRVDLAHAQREADSLKRFAEREGKQDLAEFAAMTRDLVAELGPAREVVEAGRWLRAEHKLRVGPDGYHDCVLCSATDRYDQHDPPPTHDQAGLEDDRKAAAEMAEDRQARTHLDEGSP
jgi:hypothetical protein